MRTAQTTNQSHELLVSWTSHVSQREALQRTFWAPRVRKTSKPQSNKSHVSRTHGVDLNRLYDRINLDPVIKIKYVNTAQPKTDGLATAVQPHVTRHIFIQHLGGCHKCTFLCSRDAETTWGSAQKPSQSEVLLQRTPCGPTTRHTRPAKEFALVTEEE